MKFDSKRIKNMMLGGVVITFIGTLFGWWISGWFFVSLNGGQGAAIGAVVGFVLGSASRADYLAIQIEQSLGSNDHNTPASFSRFQTVPGLRPKARAAPLTLFSRS